MHSNLRSLRRIGGIKTPTKPAMVASFCLLLAIFSAPAAGQTDPWRQTILGYLMAAGIDGNVAVGPVSADVDVSFADLLDHLKYGAMAAYRAEREPWAIDVDAIYSNLEATKDAGFGQQFDANATQALLGVDVAYRLSGRFEVLGGLRYNDINADIAAVGPTGDTRARSGSQSWVDPYVGGRYTLRFAARWSFKLRADVGGFGVGSKSAWQVVTRLNWDATDHLGVTFGYRVIDIDYEEGDGVSRFVFDAQTGGPVIGVAWTY